MLKENSRVILDENENYNSVANNILEKSNIKNYKRYIDNMFMNREIDRNMFIEIELGKNVCKKVDNDFKEVIISGYPNCLTCICYRHRRRNHNLL